MNCKIVGYEFKTLEVTLKPGEIFYSERGSIVYVEQGLQCDVEFNGSGSGLGNLLGGVLRAKLAGESILIVRITNLSGISRQIVLSGSYCSIVPIKLDGAHLISRRGLYLASTNKIRLNLNINFQGLLGGVGIFQQIEGQATVFLDAFGTPIEKKLSGGESIEVDENHIVAMQGIDSSRIQAGWSVGNILKGEGISLMRITGPGKLYISPLSFVMSGR